MPVFLDRLRSTGVTSDALHVAGLGSIAVSILVWLRASDDGGRLTAVFVGLWAPTFFVLGTALAQAEQAALPGAQR